jgi:HEAT repeat protein
MKITHVLMMMILCAGFLPAVTSGGEPRDITAPLAQTIKPDGSSRVPLPSLVPNETYRSLVSIPSGVLKPDDALVVTLDTGEGPPRTKRLHAGDPDFYLTFRVTKALDGSIRLSVPDASAAMPVRVEWSRLALGDNERNALEAEPNDDPSHANPMILGRDVYGSADDVDYLENPDEGRTGLDWFRLDFDDDEPRLVYFQLDLLDRDISCDIGVYTLDSGGKPEPYLEGKDPMEIVHDRERRRYSKHVSRVLRKGTYYILINANHPSYVLRTRSLPVPPYDDPETAVEAGMHYLMNVGDAWFAQIPREGNIYARSSNLHDTATRCTACHPSSFTTEANLIAQENGYPIRAKNGFQYVIDRLSNSITPLYGRDGLYWQRFIAIPLQAQGMQGSILADYERQIGGEGSTEFDRFVPFLRAAWNDRDSLPNDELNGVVPLDSKFGFSWRDWRVLSESANRTRNPADTAAAATIARLLADTKSDERIETFQDRIHRLHAWGLIDRDALASRIARETAAILALQNDDGGWHEIDSRRGPSAVYTTGQVVWTLLKLGHDREEPALARALTYLLARQQQFGGWFQTTTHENFRTPMRETRYAVEALAQAFPTKSAPLRSWNNRDDLPARLPRDGSVVAIVDDLENLWDVPPEDRRAFTQAILPLMEHAEPIVRAHAAACLGRLGRAEAVPALVTHLADPSKIVWRSAAWALRRLGNADIGVDAICNALDSPDPLVRRGAARVFAYQFPGMDQRLDIATRLLTLTADEDLWTRLQALKTLRQWFYRSTDSAFQRRVVYAYLSRMSLAEPLVIRKNLSEGLYIMLDENLGGGVSLQKNIEELPERLRPAILAARIDFERGVLLTPILAALESGNSLQRKAILNAFDGSFFAGRSFARRPTGMIDVGNDREFGFLHDPSASVLERTFRSLLSEETQPELRRKAILLASFFLLPERSTDPALRALILDAMNDDDPEVAAAAREVVANSINLHGLEADKESKDRLMSALRTGGSAQGAVLQALGRHPTLLQRPEIRDAVRSLLDQPNAALRMRPVLSSSIISDQETLNLLTSAYPSATDPGERLALLEVLFSRRGLLDLPEPIDSVTRLLKSGATDRSARVRERTLTVVSGLEEFWKGTISTGLLLSALSDDTPALRRLGLLLSRKKPAFWDRDDARENLLRLLVDPDATVRASALELVESRPALVDSPGFARRLKALTADPELASRVGKLLDDRHIDPSTLTADISLARPRLLSLATFREKVNPWFYRLGDDGAACAKCHANHTILRIAEAGPNGEFSSEQLITNYNSALKVVNLGQPESSLLLRKPRSPQGQGGPDAESPTGLTHVGGPRWEETEHPAYQAILSWIRDASTVARSGASDATLSADSYAPTYEPALAGDGDVSTLWHTEFTGATPGFPHDLTIDLGRERTVDGLLYVPRQDGENGRVKDFEIRLSADGKTWESPAVRGTWANDPTFKLVPIPPKRARFVQLRGLSEVNGGPWMSAADVVVDSSD